jgi:hypothetical protein
MTTRCASFLWLFSLIEYLFKHFISQIPKKCKTQWCQMRRSRCSKVLLILETPLLKMFLSCAQVVPLIAQQHPQIIETVQ